MAPTLSWRAIQRFWRLGTSGAVILHYHRVTELQSDPYQLSVTPQHFAEQLEVVRKIGTPLNLQELVEKLKENNLPKRAIVITFDDGYADNLSHAKRLLERFAIPATVFVTTGYLAAEREFWWDELEQILLQPGPLPERLHLCLNGSAYQWQLDDAASQHAPYPSDPHWNLSSQEDRSTRQVIFRSLYSHLHSLPDSECRKVLDALLLWAGRKPVYRSTHRILSPSELLKLAKDGLVEIGSHTVNHPVLTELSAEEQQIEIRQSKAYLEQILGSPILGFAYPHGSGTQQTLENVRSAGFHYACSSIRNVITSKSEIFQLPRVGIKDWDGESFARWLKNWFLT